MTLGTLQTTGVAWGAPEPPTGIRFWVPTRSGWVDGEFRCWHVLRALIDEAQPECAAAESEEPLTIRIDAVVPPPSAGTDAAAPHAASVAAG